MRFISSHQGTWDDEIYVTLYAMRCDLIYVMTLRFVITINGDKEQGGKQSKENKQIPQHDQLQDLKALIMMYDRANEKTKDYIKDVIRLEMDNHNEDVNISFDEFINIYNYVKHASFLVEMHIPKDMFESNEWCRRACTILNSYIPHIVIYLDE